MIVKMRFGSATILAAALLASVQPGAALRAADSASESVGAAVDPEVASAQRARIAAVDKAVPAVLAIMAPGGQGGGSGVVITPDGFALTNFHVAKPCGDYMKCGMPDGRLYDAVIVGVDPVGDVALIKLFGRDDFPTAEIADSDQVQVGDWCFAIGNPFLLATDFYPSVSYGVVSGTHRYQYGSGTLLEYTDCLQVDAAINPGNSGGPLFDAQGRLIGINGRGSFEKRGRVNVGVGYAISINQVRNFLGHLKAGRVVDHATLGATASTSHDGRVLVSEILDDSDAYRRGLRYDDEIVAFAGRPIPSTNALKNILGIFPKGWRLPLTYRRDGQNYDILVRLMGVHSEAELLAKLQGIMPEEPGPKLPDRDKHKDEPKDEPKGEGEDHPSDQPPVPGRPPRGGAARKLAAKPAMPDEVKKQFESRTGYANYYFNRAGTERVWKALSSRGDFSSLGGTWKIEGKPLTAGEVVLHLADDECAIELPIDNCKITIADGLDRMLNPPGSGGLLAALHLWRKLLVGGPGSYGQITYEGTAPLPGHDGLFDVLRQVAGGVEALLYVDPADGELVAIEMFGDDFADPCEVYFSDYREVDGRWLPHHMEVRHGDETFGEFMFTSFDLEPTATD